MTFRKGISGLLILFLFLMTNKTDNCMAQTIDMSKTLNEPYLYKSSFMKDKEMPDKKDTLVKVDSMLEVEGKRNNRFKVLRLTIDTQVYMVRLFSI